MCDNFVYLGTAIISMGDKKEKEKQFMKQKTELKVKSLEAL
jgi:hypothetical protein